MKKCISSSSQGCYDPTAQCYGASLSECNPGSTSEDGLWGLPTCGSSAATTAKSAELFEDAEPILLSFHEQANHKVLAGAAGTMLGGILMVAALKIRNSMRRTDDAAYENLEA